MALFLSIWIILTLSVLLTTLGKKGPWGRALGPKVAEETREQCPIVLSCHVLRARGGEDKVPGGRMLQAAH